MTKKVFGFDLGIASIGWAAVEFDDEFVDPNTGEILDFEKSSFIKCQKQLQTYGKILKSGVRIFTAAEHPKDGASLAKPRRMKRLARRSRRRKVLRMKEIKQLFVSHHLVQSEEELNTIYANQVGGDVWNLRIKALEEELTSAELVRVLTHLAKHRGFLSYRKSDGVIDPDSKDETKVENGKVLKAIRANQSAMTSYRTLAEMIVVRAGSKGKKRNYTETIGKKPPTAVYVNSIPRGEIRKELDLIYQKQQELYHGRRGIFTQELYEEFWKIASRYREVGSIEDKIGKCRFEHEESRAPKEAPSAELFVAWSKLNNLKVQEGITPERFLTQTEKNQILELIKKTKKGADYKAIGKALFPHSDVRFSGIDYTKKTKRNKKGEVVPNDVTSTIFYRMTGWHELKSIFSDAELEQISVPVLDKVVTIIATEKEDKNIIPKLQKLPLSPDQIEKCLTLSFSTFIHLSLKALYNILPFMEEGSLYNEACDKAGYDFKDSGESLVLPRKDGLLDVIPDDKQTTVPVVNRTVAQFRKVYNAMVKRYGIPDEIHIENGRELNKTFDERRDIQKMIAENTAERAVVKENLEELGINPTATNILKLRLYLAQGCKSLYSGKTIDPKRLDENGYLEIDHIIPYSRSLDNSFANKTLCFTDENRKKGNKTPFEHMGNSDEWNNFKGRVLSTKSLKRKTINNLLNETFQNRELEFRSRNANDNSHISRYVRQYLEDGLKGFDCKVRMNNGYITDYLRHQWGLKKDRNASDKHHAQDAIVIACATQKAINKLCYLSGVFENKDRWRDYQQKSLGSNQAEVWYHYLKTTEKMPWDTFHEDVEKSLEDVFVSRSPRKKATGEIHGETVYPTNPAHKNYKEDVLKSGMPLRGGWVTNGNGSMLRTDVFSKKDKKGKEKFYLVPVYLSSMGKELPNKAIVPLKPESEWLKIDETYHFNFSLYMDDLVKLTKKETVIFGYFKGTNRFTSSVIIETPAREEVIKGIGVQTQDKIQKYTVSPLGDYTEVKQEKRLPLTNIKSVKQKQEDRRKHKM